MKVEKLTVTTIKPSIPTPEHKRFVKLSLLDQLSPLAHIDFLLFYPPPINSGKECQRQQLSNSLSETLNHYYPYAGRIINSSEIKCNDEGIVYVESEVDFEVNDVLLKRDLRGKALKQFMPDVSDLEELKTIPMIIQVIFFKCGGIAIGVLFNHRIMDGFGIATFIRSWARATIISGHGDLGLTTPDFTVPSTLYPPRDLFNTVPKRPLMKLPTKIWVTKRYIFKASNISKMKEKFGSKTTNPTRVGVISSLIWKCAIKASHTSSSSSTSSIWTQLINTRRKFDVPLPDNTPGNHWSSFSVRTVHHDEEVDGLARLLKHGLLEYCNIHMKKLQDSESSVRCSAISDYFQEIMNSMKENEDTERYMSNSWCGFKLYDADFGRGKPEWIAFPNFPFKNMILLIDTNEGKDIEAWVTLSEDHMAAFEQEEGLLLFTD